MKLTLVFVGVFSFLLSDCDFKNTIFILSQRNFLRLPYLYAKKVSEEKMHACCMRKLYNRKFFFISKNRAGDFFIITLLGILQYAYS